MNSKESNIYEIEFDLVSELPNDLSELISLLREDTEIHKVKSINILHTLPNKYDFKIVIVTEDYEKVANRFWDLVQCYESTKLGKHHDESTKERGTTREVKEDK